MCGSRWSGIELLTIDARIVVASVDTYLRFAEAVNRLDLSNNEPRQLPEWLGEVKEQGAKKVTKGALKAGKEKASEALHGEDEDADEDEGQERRVPRARKRPSRAERAS